MSSAGLAKFATPIGACAIAWGPSGILGVQLPGASELGALARLQKRYPFAEEAEPLPEIAHIIVRIAAFLDGVRDDFSDLPYDFGQVTEFEAAVYRETLAIPAGETSTYGAIAVKLGDLGHSRAVGQALGHNPWPIVIPCHRVTGADGKMGGFSAPGGRETKLKLLEIEGALAPESLPLFAAT